MLLLLFTAALFSGCKDQDPLQNSKFILTFRATYDDQLLEKFKNYPYGGKVVVFDKFNTYLSDISLLQGSEEIKLADVEWVDFTPDFAPDNKTVEVTFEYTVPSGDYDGIKIGYGVKPALNAKTPADFAPEHPLYLENEYWLGWKSYIFTKIQGEVDLDGDGTAETNIFYHCGADTVYNAATFPRDIALSDDASLAVEFDLKKMFTFDGQLLDLTIPDNQATSHSPSNIALGYKMMHNFKNATVLK